MTTVTPISAPQMGELASQLQKAGYGSADIDRLRANMPRLYTLLDELRGKRHPLLADDWIDHTIEAEQKALQAFFGISFILDRFREKLSFYGRQTFLRWLELGLEPHFLPRAVFTRDLELPGWKVKPEDWYWEELDKGNLSRPNVFPWSGELTGEPTIVRTAMLDGIVVLIDTRCKPHYKKGKQMWPGDKLYLGSVLAKLRNEGAIKRYGYGSQASRFGVTADEWRMTVQNALAEHVKGSHRSAYRFETVLEANVIPQLYGKMPRAKDGNTTSCVLYQEQHTLSKRNLLGGNADHGGLSHVHYNDDADGVSIRPIVVLD